MNRHDKSDLVSGKKAQELLHQVYELLGSTHSPFSSEFDKVGRLRTELTISVSKLEKSILDYEAARTIIPEVKTVVIDGVTYKLIRES